MGKTVGVGSYNRHSANTVGVDRRDRPAPVPNNRAWAGAAPRRPYIVRRESDMGWNAGSAAFADPNDER